MSYIIVGLGNPGEEYKNTRHNTGRIVLGDFLSENNFSLDTNKKLKALYGKGVVGKEKIEVVFPETFMNKSGSSVAPLVKSVKKAHNLIVVYDDLDLPVGHVKMSFNRGSGGHKGLESIMRAVKTKEFIRLRVGICPTTPAGKMKKPHGEKEVSDFIMESFSSKEKELINLASKKVAEAIEKILTDGYEKAMGEVNSHV